MNQYTEILAENDTYTTDERRIKSSIVPSGLRFYLKIAKVVLYSNRWAKKGMYNDYRWVYSSLDILHIAESCGIRFEIKGMNNLKKFDGPAVFVSNHMSTMETFTLPSIINPVKRTIYVIKKELADYPFFGPVAKARSPITVGRDNPRDDLKIVMEEGSKKLSEKISIIIFPQKTRSADFDSSTFNSLGVKLAKKNNVPVVPIALVTDAWGNGKRFKDIGKIDTSKRVHIELGEPIFVTDNGAEAHERVINFIKDKLTQWDRSDLIKN